MVNKIELLRGNDIIINDNITIHHPTMDEIYNFGEKKYFGMVGTIISVPSDFMVQLWDIGVDFTTLPQLDFFYSLTRGCRIEDTNLLFGDLNFSEFLFAEDVQTKEKKLFNNRTKAVIDICIYTLIVEYLKEMHHIHKEVLNLASSSEYSKKYLIDVERRNLARQSNTPYESQLSPLVSSLVNSKEFKYDYETVWSLPVYQFYDAFMRINHIKHSEQVSYGIYTGNIDSSKLNTDSINWAANL